MHLKRFLIEKDRYLGCRLFSNPEGVVLRLRGAFVDGTGNFAQESETNEYVAVNEAIDDADIQNIKEKIDEMVDEGVGLETEYLDGEKFITIIGDKKIDTRERFHELNNILENEDVRSELESYVGQDFEVEYCSIMRYHPSSEGSKKRTREWHLDLNEAIGSVRLLVYLDNIASGKASTRLFSREYTREILSSKNVESDGLISLDRQSIDEEPQNVECRKGDCLIFKPYLNFHRGTNSSDQVRDVVAFIIKPS